MSIVKVKSGNYTYLYESRSYREDGKVKNERYPIGRVDPVTGDWHYKPEYIERMREKGSPVSIAPTAKIYSAKDICESEIKSFGSFYLLKNVSNKIGLIDSLKEALPNYWEEIFMLAAHLVVNGDAVMHCSDWLETIEACQVKSLTSQLISELLSAITPEERMNFYHAWCKRRLEEEYLALDITSVSSYSDLIEDVEWGCNRDGENLPQVNICMLMGEQSRLPIYQSVYAGSLKDVSTLKTTTKQFENITDGKPLLYVMDKGFYSKRNVNSMLAADNCRFIIAVSFTAKFATNQVDSERKDIDVVEKTIKLGSETMRAVTKQRAWGNDEKVYTHTYFAPRKALGHKEDIFGYVVMLKEEAETNPTEFLNSTEHKKYLNIRKSQKSETGYTISIKNNAVDAALGTQGWLVIISNHISDAKEAIKIYRAKDVVEKGFLKLKTNLELGRLRVHEQDRMQNKVFVGFIALVLMSHIHIVMSDEKLYDKMTGRQLLRTLSKHRVQYIGGERIVYPATKAQRNIYEAFGVKVPT
jgi:transposase